MLSDLIAKASTKSCEAYSGCEGLGLEKKVIQAIKDKIKAFQKMSPWERIFWEREHLKCASYETLMQYAEETPIIDEEEVKNSLAENEGANVTIQNYCQSILGQPDIQLQDIASLAPSQAAARENATYWINTLYPKSRKTYTRAKSTLSLYSLDNEDVEELTNLYATDPTTFAEVMAEFANESRLCESEATDLREDLQDFSTNLYSDLRNFRTIKTEATQKYETAGGAIAILQDTAETLVTIIVGLNEEIATLTKKLSSKNPLSIALSYLNLWVGVGSTVARVKSRAQANALLTELTVERDQQQSEHDEIIVKIQNLAQQLAALEGLSANYDGLDESCESAIDASNLVANTWIIIANNFNALADSVEAVPTEGSKIIVRARLRQTAEVSQSLRTLCEDYERAGLVEVEPEEALLRIYPKYLQYWSRGGSIPGEVFASLMTYVHGQKGRFSRITSRLARTAYERRHRLYLPIS